MMFATPSALWLMLLLPVAAALYSVRRGLFAARGRAPITTGGPSGMVRHSPALMLLCSLAAYILALARPEAALLVPTRQETIILALDVSVSMGAKDTGSPRLDVLKKAAINLVRAAPWGYRFGVVAFGGTASLIQQPTGYREDVIAAINGLGMQKGTAIGNGIIASLAAVFPGAGIGGRAFGNVGKNSHYVAMDAELGLQLVRPVAPGSHRSAAIVLISDGQSTVGPDPLKAARVAANRGVRVYTVGIGTAQGEIVKSDGWSMRVRLNEKVLAEIAAITSAAFFPEAGSALQAEAIYQPLSAGLKLEKRRIEVTSLFCAAGLFLSIVSALLSLCWSKRIV